MATESFLESRRRLKREEEARGRAETIRKKVQTTSAKLSDLLRSGPRSAQGGLAGFSPDLPGGVDEGDFLRSLAAPTSPAQTPAEHAKEVERASVDKKQALESAIVDLALKGGDTAALTRVAGDITPKAPSPKTSAPTDIDDFVRRADEESIRTTGKGLTPGKKNQAALKFKRAQSEEVEVNRFASRFADSATAERIARNKERGKALAVIETAGGILKAKGIQTPIQKIGIAKKRMGANLAKLSNHFLNLDSMGAITNVDKGTMENIFAATRASTVGQSFGRITGSNAQSVRKSINNIKPLLLQDIRQSTDMGARGLDSEKELAFYLQAATDEKADIQSNIAAIVVLDEAFGDGAVAEQLRDLTDESLIKRIATEGDKILAGGSRQAPGGQGLPEGVTEDDIRETMRVNKMTRQDVLSRLQGAR